MFFGDAPFAYIAVDLLWIALLDRAKATAAGRADRQHAAVR
jgi:hypothetical protein